MVREDLDQTAWSQAIPRERVDQVGKNRAEDGPEARAASVDKVVVVDLADLLVVEAAVVAAECLAAAED